METIIYFQKKRGLKEPVIEPIGMKTYLLVRVTLNVEREEWFGASLKEPEVPGDAGNVVEPVQTAYEDSVDALGASVFEGNSEASKVSIPDEEDSYPERVTARCEGARAVSPRKRNRCHFFHPFKALRQRREEMTGRQQECERRFQSVRDYHIQLELWQQRMQEIEAAIQTLMQKMMELPQPEEPVYAVYEDCLRTFLVGENGSENAKPERRLRILWKRHVDLAEFGDYTSPFWIEQTLPEHLPPRFLIVGRNRNICPILERCTNRLKSIRWLLPEKDCTADFRDYLEAFYEEYGLVISYRTFSDPGQLRRTELSCEEETVIFDFTREGYVQTAGVARGSIWLDLYSVEEKQKKMECRNPGIFYFSLKKKWKQVQKVRNMPFFLDTAKENGYNTWESEGI